MSLDFIHVQCVYGEANIAHIESVLIPALKKATKYPLKLATTNYNPKSSRRLKSFRDSNFELVDLENEAPRSTGFATNHNVIFKSTKPKDFFVILNPDCIPHEECIDRLISRKQNEEKAAIIEGRQWPFEHPKEYDTKTLETPWASGAFALIDSDFYRQVGGMDETYFLYVEDVDLSWQAWLNGYRVIYEPEASVTHFSGGPFYRRDLISNEEYLSLRNFILISRKFFGKKGEATAKRLLKTLPNDAFARIAIKDYETNFQQCVPETYLGKNHPNVKILGVNLFHSLRVP